MSKKPDFVSPASDGDGGAENDIGADGATANSDGTTSSKTPHRRTRSGCYTCRQRRVKCDETRPRCIRCQKGSRECSFPEKTVLTRKQRSRQMKLLKKAASVAAAAASSSTSQSTEVPSHSTTIKTEIDHLESTSHTSPVVNPASSSLPVTGLSDTSEDVSNSMLNTPSSQLDSSLGVPSDSSHTILPQIADPAQIPFLTEQFPNVHPDIAALMLFHRQYITHCHYFISNDPIDFFQRLTYTIPSSPSLMYALAAFSAYHYAVRYGEMYLENMFHYYECCVRSLLTDISEPDLYILTAIIILSLIEAYLGDTLNELAHQNAVFHMFQTTYNLDTAFQTDMQLYFFSWLRFLDLRQAFVSGGDLHLDLIWQARHRQIIHLVREDTGQPTDIIYRLHKFFINLAINFVDLYHFAQRVQRGELSPVKTMRQGEVLRSTMMALFETMDQSIFELVDPPPDTLLSDEDRELVPPLCYKHWRVAYAMIIFYSWKLYYSSFVDRSQDQEDRSDMALTICRCVSGLEAVKHINRGCLIVAHNYICLAAPLLKPPYRNWARRKLAQIQAEGYNFSDHFRHQLAKTWQNEELTRGWLEGIDAPAEAAFGAAIPFDKLLQVKIPQINKQKEPLAAALREFRGIFNAIKVGEERKGNWRSIHQ
ncbi:hypothetical protein V1511DRAFT_312802 [Dipodascopsis uninucleata]